MTFIKTAALLLPLVATLSVSAMGSDHAGLTQVVTKAPVRQAISASPQTVSIGSSVQVATSIAGLPTSIPTGAVRFSLVPISGTGTTVSSDLIALQPNGSANWTVVPPVGTYTATAAYSGDANYLADSTSGVATIKVEGTPDFSVSIPSDLTITQGSSGTAIISVTPVNGFEGTVTFACSGMPAQSSCSFSQASVVVPATSPTQASVPALSTSITVTTAGTVVTTLGFITLLVGFSSRSRRRSRALLSSALIASCGLCAVLALTGCIGSNRYIQSNGTPLGTYQLTVVASSGSITHSNTVNLHVVAR